MGKGKPQPIGAVVSAVLARAKQQHGEIEAIRRRWRTLVGPTLAAHTKPLSLRRGRLVVLSEGPGESFTLSYQRARLLAQLRRSTKGAVDELVIRPGTVRET